MGLESKGCNIHGTKKQMKPFDTIRILITGTKRTSTSHIHDPSNSSTLRFRETVIANEIGRGMLTDLQQNFKECMCTLTELADQEAGVVTASKIDNVRLKTHAVIHTLTIDKFFSA